MDEFRRSGGWLSIPPRFSYLLQCQIDRIVFYSECISYQACLLRTCTLYSSSNEQRGEIPSASSFACVLSLENAAIRWPVWNSHIHYRVGHCVSNVRRFRRFFRRRLLTAVGFYDSLGTGRGLIRSLRLWRFLTSVSVFHARGIHVLACIEVDWNVSLSFIFYNINRHLCNLLLLHNRRIREYFMRNCVFGKQVCINYNFGLSILMG